MASSSTTPLLSQHHVIYTEDGRVREEFIEATTFEEAEAKFVVRHPAATYWEIGF